MASMQKNYWHTTVQMPDDPNPSTPPAGLAPLPEKVDVAVIGGGYTGLSAARTLAQNGVNVAVLEANTIGWGASSRNGGMVLTGLKPGMQAVMKKFGRHIARQLFQSSLDSIDTVEQIVRRKHRLRLCTLWSLLTANKPRHYEGLRDEVEFMEKKFNHKVRLVPGAE
jgi:glycine/D-amino acid oxidase-like deaminating enzyme